MSECLKLVNMKAWALTHRLLNGENSRSSIDCAMLTLVMVSLNFSHQPSLVDSLEKFESFDTRFSVLNRAL